MSTLVLVVSPLSSLLFAIVNGCSISHPPLGTYYINYVQLLDAEQYPDEVLLTISKISQERNWSNDGEPGLYFDDTGLSIVGEWCKIMNVNNGSVGNVVDCDDYHSSIGGYATTDNTSSISVGLQNEKFLFIERGGQNYTIYAFDLKIWKRI